MPLSFRRLVLVLLTSVLVRSTAFGQAEAGKPTDADNQTAAQKERTEALLKWTRKFAQDTRITVLNKGSAVAELRA